MIQAFQKFSESRVAKVFLAIVALSFVAFFGGGSWFRPHDPNAVVAEVGNLSVSRYEFVEKVQQQAQRIMAQSGESMTREDMLKAGLPQIILSQLIQEILLNLEADHLGLTVSDETLRDQIQSIKAFQNEKGVFDRALFTQVLRNNSLSEDSFIAEVRKELIREQLISAIMVGAYVSDDIVDRLFDAQYQYRQAAMLMVSPKEMPLPESPTNVVLEAFYNDHQKKFQTPELRKLTALVIDPASYAKEISVSPEEIRAVYEAKPEYKKRSIDSAKPLIIAEIQKEKAMEKLFQVTQDLDDKIAGGATLEELAPSVQGAELVTLDGVDAQGRNQMAVTSSALPKNTHLAQELLQTAFSTDEGSDSPFTQAKDGTYYLVRVDKVIPTALQPFAEIKDRVLKVWTEYEQLKAAHAKAEKYVQAFNQGDRKVSLMTLLPNLSLSEPSQKVSNEVKELVFSLRPDRAGVTFTPQGFAVVVLNKIIPPRAQVKEEKLPAFKKKLLEHYQNDLVGGYVNSLRIRYPVKVNSKALKALFSQG
ncbi:MAG TPA: SurA N-terminal domain-containing protein [Alphaproteobacteria bacterium]|nr:SurA N-terminal domain-containing protein [Alphaproteobacteria bacterium]